MQFKFFAALSAAAAVFAVAAPVFFSGPQAADPEPEATVPLPRAIVEVREGYSDDGLKLTLLNDGREERISMFQYLSGVVAAEMPANFQTEALAAQAVAARTYALYKMLSTEKAHDADVCGDYTCCAAYMDEESLREKWGDDFSENMQKITDAIRETDGLYLAYCGEPALAVFHSSSDGMTESCSQVWGQDLPYLQSVATPETSEDVPDFKETVLIAPEEFKRLFLEKYPQADFSGEPKGWITDIEYSDSGRVKSLSVGGVTVTGSEFRLMYSLRSANMELEASELGVSVTTSGYGHGVGMSQYGANVLASRGDSFQEILAAYYPGTELFTVY